MTFLQGMLIVHLIGLAMGFSVSIANIVMGVLIARSSSEDRAVLSGFLPRMSKVGSIGLLLLWVSGGFLLYPMWDGLAAMPWQLVAKLVVVLLLTATVFNIHRLEFLIGQGDETAKGRIQVFGKLATVFAVLSLVLAVLAFH